MHFVYRSHYEGALSKLVRRLPDETALAWFRRGWACEDPSAWVEAELGVDVYGLDSIFEAAREGNLARPETTGELRALLHEHLYVEGGTDHIRLDEDSLRVRRRSPCSVRHPLQRMVWLSAVVPVRYLLGGGPLRSGAVPPALRRPLGPTGMIRTCLR